MREGTVKKSNCGFLWFQEAVVYKEDVEKAETLGKPEGEKTDGIYQ